jgi:enamine deaminase RidA (YjgF/YER057c/UK114 family)
LLVERIGNIAKRGESLDEGAQDGGIRSLDDQGEISSQYRGGLPWGDRKVSVKIILLSIAIIMLWTVPHVSAQEREMILPVPQSAYSQAVKVKGGTLVFLSGVGPVDEKGALLAAGDYRGQVNATWENMRRIMAKVGGSLDDIVTMTVYTTERRWGEIFTDMRKEVFKTGYPSSAFMEARKLKTPGAMIEIQAIAVLKD